MSGTQNRWARLCPRYPAAGPAGSRQASRSESRWLKIRRPEAQRLIALVSARLRIMRRPSGTVLKQSDGANSTVRAQIEPMMCSAWHTKQVARSDFDRNHRCALRMNVKYTPPGENEPHFIFIVPMFAIETGEHFVES